MCSLYYLTLLYMSIPDKPLIACHRGIMAEAQENTEDGIKLAVDYKLDIVDLDIMVTNAGEIVCSHDENVNYLVDGHQDCFIKTLSRDDIAKLQISDTVYYGTQTMKYKTKNKFCFLDEVFTKYCDNIIFWLDIKEPSYRPWHGTCQAAVTISNFIIKNKKYVNRMIIGSTNPFVIYYIRKRLKSYDFYKDLVIGNDYGPTRTCMINLALKSGFLEWLFSYNFIGAGRDYVTQKFIDSTNKRNIKLMPYAWNKGEEMQYKNVWWYLVQY
jgi:glycerophosphoryl diester phosphodiesterase